MIRLATVSDLPGLAGMEGELFGADAWDVNALRAELDGLGRRFVVAEAGDDLVGYAISMTLGDVVDLQRIGVRPNQQRSGVASGLLDDLVAHQHGADRMLLEVSAANVSAIAYYARHGFTQINVRASYYRDGSDALVMSRALATGVDERWGRIES